MIDHEIANKSLQKKSSILNSSCKEKEKQREMPEIDEKSFLEEEDLQTWNSRPFCHLVDLLSKRIVTAGVSPRRIVAREVPDQPQPGRDTIYHVRGILGMPLLKTKGPWKRRKREKLSAGRKNDKERDRKRGKMEKEREIARWTAWGQCI